MIEPCLDVQIPMPKILPTVDPIALAERADAIADAARELAAFGWTPATSSNFSMRIDEDLAAITISGRDKGRLGRDDIMVVDMEGKAVGSDHRPSAETGLHTQVYRRFPGANVVLHTHSRTQSVASRLFASQGRVHLEGWELQKAISGYTTHESVLDIPVFPNTQHMPELEAQVDNQNDEYDAKNARNKSETEKGVIENELNHLLTAKNNLPYHLVNFTEKIFA